MGNQKSDKKAIIATFILPIIIGIIITVISFNVIDSKEIKLNSEKTLSFIDTMLGIWATLLGFMITSLSILIGFKGSERTQLFIESKHYSTILYTYIITCIELFLCMVIYIPVILLEMINLLTYSMLIGLLLITAILILLCLMYLLLIIITAFQDNKHENWN